MKFEMSIPNILLIICLLFSMIGGCNSCGVKKKIESSNIELKTSIYNDFYTKEELDIALKIKGLEDERRSVLNINQIFLTQKRPDQRVIEIDQEISKLQKEKLQLQKTIKENAKPKSE